MSLRKNKLTALTNYEVESYLAEKDTIFVAFGPTEMHGALPLDCETVVSEGVAKLLAEKTNSLYLTATPFIYSGATASGRGTTQLSVEESSRYLKEIAHSLLRQGFKKQIYLSLHGPAHIPMGVVLRDFFDETGISLQYINLMQIWGGADWAESDPVKNLAQFDKMIIGAYKLLNRLDDVPLQDNYHDTDHTSSVSQFSYLTSLSYESTATGYYFAEHMDHMPTINVPDEETREKLADEGIDLLNKLIDLIDTDKLFSQMSELQKFIKEQEKEKPWVPSAYNKAK